MLSRRLLIIAQLNLVLLATTGCRSPIATSQPALVQSFQLDTSAPSTPGQLVVGSYNIHWLSQPAELNATLAKLQQVNVWCLQEVRIAGEDEASTTAALKHILPPGTWHVAVARVNLLRELDSTDWECQVIVSRFPISNVRTFPLDDTGAKLRVALAADLKVNGQSICVVNTDHEPSFLMWRNRNKLQVEALVTALDSISLSHVVVAGDFNCAGNIWRAYGNGAHVSRLDAALSAIFFNPAIDKSIPTFRTGLLDFVLDRIYLRELYAVEQGIDHESTGSDHFPIWAALEIESHN